ncbi:MAG: L-threonylcarbamoyladenylate synthase [Thermoplasmata archaeon]|jgi:L-threonylcarbamoyladenylate synthase|nr:L-threonylcarbamoyladenylate synthase [Thermoplasmata archaeon]
MSRLVAPDAEGIRLAADALRAGALVVFPTETVYGVGADALRPDAVARIFAAKGRPADNPLIVHVADLAAARALARAWPPAAETLARAFWPGPLTLVVPRGPRVPDITAGGLDSVALRVPAHPAARALLAESGLPIAAPSANRSGRPSPTRVADAREDLGDAVAVYLDGGPAQVGVESTVVSVLGPKPVVLRPGGTPVERIREALGEVGRETGSARSPGTRYRHYAPSARVVLSDSAGLRAAAGGLPGRVAIVAAAESGLVGPDVRVPGSRRDAEAWARQLFALLRDLDAEGYDAIVVEAIPEEGVGHAVMERLRKAAEGSR